MQATSPPRAAESSADAPKQNDVPRRALRTPLPRKSGLQRQQGRRRHNRHNRHVRRLVGVGVATLGVAGLIGGSAVSSSAAEAQVERLATSTIAAISVSGGVAPGGVAPGGTAEVSAAGSPPADPSNSTAEWSAMFGGDSLLTRPRGGDANPFDIQLPLLRSADLAVVNVETAISDSTFKEPKQYNFKSPVSFATQMGEAGIDVGSLANNHSMDFGDQGMLDTVDALQDAGVVPVGAGINRDAALTPSFHSIKGLRVAVIGASQVIPDQSWVATANTIGIASAGKDLEDAHTQSLTQAIRNARLQADVVIVFMHWGNEREVCPTDLQQRTAQVLHAAGASVVVGAHPHVLQPLVRSAGNVTAYSLGNFVWDPRSGITADTGVLEIRFRGPAIASVVFHPHHLNGNGWAAPVSNAQAQERILGQVERNCTGADGTGSLDR